MFGDSIPLRHYDDFGRVLQITFVLLALIVLWRGTKILAIRRESRPADPLGIGPDASTFGNNIGACAVLLAMSCLGVVTRWHEVGSEGLSFFLQNNWEKKLIIWVCNRFDYAHGSKSGFPEE